MKPFLTMILLLVSPYVISSDYAFDVNVSGKGPAVVLIPGFNSSGETWDETVSAYKSDYELHVLTLNGFAGSKASVKSDVLNTMVRDIQQYIRDKQLAKPTIIGHSLGGFLAMKIAIEDSSLVNKLVIVDSLPFLPAAVMPGVTVESAKPMAENMRNQISSQTESQYRQTAPMFLSEMSIHPEKIKTLIEWGASSDRDVSGQVMYELYTSDIRQDIAKIKVPTLVLGAWIGFKNFGATRESSMAMYKAQYAALGGVDIQFTDKGKHFIMWDDPAFFHQHVGNFLNQ